MNSFVVQDPHPLPVQAMYCMLLHMQYPLNDSDLDLATTLDCGQCFRWIQAPDGAWEGVIGTQFHRLSQSEVGDPDGIFSHNAQLADYFDLATDYQKILASFQSMGGHLAASCDTCHAIRILRQDPWEALLSFVLSQNNNIKRIRLIIERLCDAYGEPVQGTSRKTFPTPEALACASEGELRDLGAGFRAPYVLDAARQVRDKVVDLESIGRMELPQARSALQQIHGVGPKVAECALLYGMHRLEAFPMDVWMKRVMDNRFDGADPAMFGPYAGIAQQYLFHAERSNG